MARPGPLSGQKLGDRYLLGDLLGIGGFGAVYQAKNLQLPRLQAIKVLLEEHFSDERFRERFIREARTLASLDHPHIVHVDELGSEGQRIYLVMPYLNGGTLQEVLKRRAGPLGLDELFRYLEHLCTALGYAHAQGVAHLDLKPLNLLLHEDGRLLLSDFGLAHLMEQGAIEGGTSLQFGSPLYMAPEHFDGKPQQRSDIYALGVILYQMLTGHPPFEGSTPAAIMRKHLNDPPPSLLARRPDLPPELEGVLTKALAKQPEQRYATAGDLFVAFKAAMAGREEQPGGSFSGQGEPQHHAPARPDPTIRAANPPIIAPVVAPGVPPPPTPTLPAPHPSGMIPPAAMAGVMPPQPSSVLPTARWEGRPPERGVPLAFGPNAPALPQVAEQPQRWLSRRKVVIGLVGLAVVGSSVGAGLVALSGQQQQSLIAPRSTARMGTTVYLTYRGHTDNVNALSWSPDKQHIASGSNDQTVQVWDASSGAPGLTFRQHSAPVFGVLWSPNGKQIASGSLYGLLLVWEPTQGNIIQTLQHIQGLGANAPEVSGLAWSPDGARVAAEAFIEGVTVWEVSTGKRAFGYSGHFGPVHAVAWSPAGQWIASGSDDRTVQVWDALTGDHPLVYRHHSEAVTSVGWSPNQQYIASGSLDKTVQVWEVATGRQIYTYRGHTAEVWAVRWSPDGTRIASASSDGTVQVWDALSGQHEFTYRGHTGPVRTLAWSPDGKQIASGSTDKTVQVWEAR